MSRVDANGSIHDRQGRFDEHVKPEAELAVLSAGPGPRRIEPGAMVEFRDVNHDIRRTGTLVTPVFEGHYMLGELDVDGQRFRSEGRWTRID